MHSTEASAPLVLPFVVSDSPDESPLVQHRNLGMTAGKGSKAVSMQRGRCVCVFCAPLSFTACVWVDGYVIELGSVCFVGGRGFVMCRYGFVSCI